MDIAHRNKLMYRWFLTTWLIGCLVCAIYYFLTGNLPATRTLNLFYGYQLKLPFKVPFLFNIFIGPLWSASLIFGLYYFNKIANETKSDDIEDGLFHTLFFAGILSFFLIIVLCTEMLGKTIFPIVFFDALVLSLFAHLFAVLLTFLQDINNIKYFVVGCITFIAIYSWITGLLIALGFGFIYGIVATIGLAIYLALSFPTVIIFAKLLKLAWLNRYKLRHW